MSKRAFFSKRRVSDPKDVFIWMLVFVLMVFFFVVVFLEGCLDLFFELFFFDFFSGRRFFFFFEGSFLSMVLFFFFEGRFSSVFVGGGSKGRRGSVQALFRSEPPPPLPRPSSKMVRFGTFFFRRRPSIDFFGRVGGALVFVISVARDSEECFSLAKSDALPEPGVFSFVFSVTHFTCAQMLCVGHHMARQGIVCGL